MDIRYFLVLLLLSPPCAVYAQIYKVVTPDGRVIYTDNPPENVAAEEVDLPALIIEPAAQVRSQASSDTPQGSQQPSQSLPKPSISRPAEQQVIPPGQRQVTVMAEAGQPLPEGFRYILLVNGAVQGQPVTTPVWTLDNPNPGEQRAQIAIVDQNGSRQALSDTRTFYVIR